MRRWRPAYRVYGGDSMSVVTFVGVVAAPPVAGIHGRHQ